MQPVINSIANTPKLNAVVQPPQLVFRVGFAGSRNLDDSIKGTLKRDLGNVFETISLGLDSVKSLETAGDKTSVTSYFSDAQPLFRLITGLCEGADAVANEAFNITYNTQIEKELAAIVPFPLPDYRNSFNDPNYHSVFDQLVERCSYIVELDGIFDTKKNSPEEKALADQRRNRGYLGQSAMLLRHSDIIIAASDPSKHLKPGGTLGTARDALAFELPVIFYHTGIEKFFLIEPKENFYTVVMDRNRGFASTDPNFREFLKTLIKKIVANPVFNNPIPSGENHGNFAGADVLEEYFYAENMPPFDNKSNKFHTNWRQTAWTLFAKLFRSGAAPISDPLLNPYETWLTRAENLNSYYSGMYRGAFLYNCLMIVVAVGLATLSLTLIGVLGIKSSEPGWLKPVLLFLGAIKFFVIKSIVRNTERANHEKWSDRAVDYRYLAERLRGLNYLPLAGSFQPPAAAPPQYASRYIRQSAIDWLFDSINRSVSPPHLHSQGFKTINITVGHNKCVTARVYQIDAAKIIKCVKENWIFQQALYHRRNSRMMRYINLMSKWISSTLGRMVKFFLILDIILIFAEIFHLLPHELEILESATPWLIFVTALIPVMVASLNGLRFQTECQSLSERSAVMRVILIGRPSPNPISKKSVYAQRWDDFKLVLTHLAGLQKKDSPTAYDGGRWKEADLLLNRIVSAKTDPNNAGAWVMESMFFTENVAEDFVREVAEWSVLYAKELPEPG
jgi:hypothetical protein